MKRLSQLFGIDVYGVDGNYKGKIYDLVVNLESGCVETMTFEPLKVRTKQDAKKIITEKSAPYKNVVAVRDIIIISSKSVRPESSQSAAPSEDATKKVHSSLVKYR